jgi:hypothetical protein
MMNHHLDETAMNVSGKSAWCFSDPVDTNLEWRNQSVLVGFSFLKGFTEMSEILWILQTLLALLFLSSGIAKSFMSKQRMLATEQTGAAAMPLIFVRFIAVCEILGAVGLIVPRASAIYPELTPLAAVGLGLIMAGAAVVHYSIHEFKPIVVNAILFCLCIFIAWGRH